MKKKWTQTLNENLSYKIVALFISLILWLTILGRRDFVYSKNVELDLITAPGVTVTAQTADKIRVKVSGPRTALKKFMDSGFSQSIAIDISQRGEGVLDVEIPLQKLEVPMGVKIISVRPSVIRAEVTKSKVENKTEGQTDGAANSPTERQIESPTENEKDSRNEPQL